MCGAKGRNCAQGRADQIIVAADWGESGGDRGVGAAGSGGEGGVGGAGADGGAVGTAVAGLRH